jgi:hypothetical protein
MSGGRLSHTQREKEEEEEKDRTKKEKTRRTSVERFLDYSINWPVQHEITR